jgi:hypothetical protein
VNRLGMGMMGAVDDGCDCLVMTDGGYEITDFESKRSDEISMSAIMVMMMMMKVMMMTNEGMCGYVSEGTCVRTSEFGVDGFELK